MVFFSKCGNCTAAVDYERGKPIGRARLVGDDNVHVKAFAHFNRSRAPIYLVRLSPRRMHEHGVSTAIGKSCYSGKQVITSEQPESVTVHCRRFESGAEVTARCLWAFASLINDDLAISPDDMAAIINQDVGQIVLCARISGDNTLADRYRNPSMVGFRQRGEKLRSRARDR